jgi:hypothetical protein
MYAVKVLPILPAPTRLWYRMEQEHKWDSKELATPKFVAAD